MSSMHIKSTKETTNRYLKIIFLLVIMLATLFICIGTTNAIEYFDYSDQVIEIINDKTLSHIEKNNHQATLFGWNTQIASYIDRVTITENQDMEVSDLELVTKTTTLDEPDLITKTLYFFGIVEEPLTDEEGSAAYDAYLINYMANYKGSYIYKGDV